MSDLNNPVHRFIEKCEHRGLFRDPRQIAKLQASIKSSLIECKYYLRVTTEYESCICCSAPPTIDIPIIIYSPVITFFEESMRPMNWHPVVMPEFSFSGTVTNTVSVPLIQPPQVNLNMNMGGISVSTPVIQPPQVNLNMNMGGVSVSTPMIQTSFEPVNTGLTIGTHHSSNHVSTGMITTSFEPVQSSATITTSFEPVDNHGASAMITTSFEPI
jgi:hypothetical protein